MCACFGEVVVHSLALSLAWTLNGQETDVEAVGRQCWRNDQEVDMYLYAAVDAGFDWRVVSDRDLVVTGHWDLTEADRTRFCVEEVLEREVSSFGKFPLYVRRGVGLG